MPSSTVIALRIVWPRNKKRFFIEKRSKEWSKNIYAEA
jgi:hypothetical protein